MAGLNGTPGEPSPSIGEPFPCGVRVAAPPPPPRASSATPSSVRPAALHGAGVGGRAGLEGGGSDKHGDKKMWKNLSPMFSSNHFPGFPEFV